MVLRGSGDHDHRCMDLGVLGGIDRLLGYLDHYDRNLSGILSEGKNVEVLTMELLFVVLLAIGLIAIMVRGHGGMGCCGAGNHKQRPKKDEEKSFRAPPFNPALQVIDLRKDEYTVLSDKGENYARTRKGYLGRKKS